MDNMERRQNEELLEARRLRRQEQKRRLLMRQRVLVIVLLVIVILSLILILRGCRNRREHPELYVKKDNALELQTEPDATVNIAAVGDIMITDGRSVISSILRGPDARTAIDIGTKQVLYTIYAPAGIDEKEVISHMADIESYVRLFSPGANVELKTVI